MADYKGVIIEESLENKEILKKVKIISTKVEQVTDKHKTPWLSQWTLHTVEIPEEETGKVAEEISKSIDRAHGGSWYADFKNQETHYIIFRNKVFSVNRKSAEEYEEVKKYGISLGIPDYQLDFSPEIK
jgi:hypothetical protein